jgi:hypothetical protein
MRTRRALADEAADSSSSAVPASKRRKKSSVPQVVVELPGVTLSKSPLDMALGLSISKDDQLTVSGDNKGGFRMVRSTHGVGKGTWYYEAVILDPVGERGNVRIGWSARKGELRAPCGYDRWSYSYRDISGSIVHDSMRRDNYGEQFGPGDVIGMYIHLDRAEALEGALAKPEAGPEGNIIKFFKNGVDQGIAFKNVLPSEFRPAISVYMGGSVRLVCHTSLECSASYPHHAPCLLRRVNFGPSFIFPPPGYQSAATSLDDRHRIRPVSDKKTLPSHNLADQLAWVEKERLARQPPRDDGGKETILAPAPP